VFSKSGIVAVSVLQEPEHFGGSQETFAMLRSSLQLPILFKDFVVTDRQVELANLLGADAVLLIAKALSAPALDRLIETTVEKGMEPVIELHDSADVRKMEALDALDRVDILGLNCRDLRSLELSRTVFEELRGSLPAGKLVIAESGVRAGRDVSSLRGFDGVLVGSALTQADDMMAMAAELVNAGRSVSR
jgi:indole-3-glycerol phosphate synthase